MIATFLATTLICVFVILNVIRQKKNGKLLEPTYTNKVICFLIIFIGGATLANGLFHFSHGILGYSEFPAPFSMIVKNNIFTNVSNIIWGLFNFSVTLFIILSYRKSMQKSIFFISLSFGFIFIAFMLRFVLLASYFQSNDF